jgi:hypothetical protein
VEHPATAPGAALRELGLERLEPALRRAALETDGRPVPERLAPLLPQPVRGLAHGATLDRLVAVVETTEVRVLRVDDIDLD